MTCTDYVRRARRFHTPAVVAARGVSHGRLALLPAPSLPGVLGRTDIFVLPSHSEGLSNALMEAMSSSCACVASDVGGNRYLIENGVSGLLFPAGDREALRSHIRRFVQDEAKRKASGDAARARIDAVFSWEKVGKRYDELFSAR